jgi:hypothetical protein
VPIAAFSTDNAVRIIPNDRPAAPSALGEVAGSMVGQDDPPQLGSERELCSHTTGYSSELTGYSSELTGYSSELTGYSSELTGYSSELGGV